MSTRLEEVTEEQLPYRVEVERHIAHKEYHRLLQLFRQLEAQGIVVTDRENDLCRYELERESGSVPVLSVCPSPVESGFVPGCWVTVWGVAFLYRILNPSKAKAWSFRGSAPCA